MDAYKTVQLLIVDDFMTTPIATQNAVDLSRSLEAREGRAATLIASQLEPNEWYLRIEGELGGRLNPEQSRHRGAIRRPDGPEHARVLREAKSESIAVPGHHTPVPSAADRRYHSG